MCAHARAPRPIGRHGVETADSIRVLDGILLPGCPPPEAKRAAGAKILAVFSGFPGVIFAVHRNHPTRLHAVTDE